MTSLRAICAPFAALLVACTSAPAPAPSGMLPGPGSAPPPASSTPSVRFDEPPNRKAIDELFRGFETTLPEPATLSEQNGASIPCRDGSYATLTLLAATAKRVKVESALELVPLVPWARHADACIRQIALEVLVPKIGHDQSRLSVPPMHQTDHFQYHDIFVSLRAHLEREKVAFDPAIFQGMMLSIAVDDFPSYAHGRWMEVAERGKNFLYLVEIGKETLRVTHAHSPPDPAATDHAWTTTIASVTVSDRSQWIVTGSSAVESSNKGYVGKSQPAPFVYAFLPVAPNVMWFRDSPTGYWERLERQPAR